MQNAMLSFVTTCMGRLAFLRQTLPRLVAQPNATCIVVDYSCPEHCGDWIASAFPQVHVVRVPGESCYNRARARNAGLRAVRTPWVCGIDCDILVAPHFVDALSPVLRPGRYYRPSPRQDLGLWGTFVAERQAIEKTGGFDEVFQGWGDEDVDFFTSLEFAGVQLADFPARLLDHLPHDDQLRMQYHNNQERWINGSINKLYRFIKWDLMRLTGRPVPLAFRTRIYQDVTRQVAECLQDGHAHEIVITLGTELLPIPWQIERRLTYVFQSACLP